MNTKIAVIGAGQMGNGIAQVAAASGFEVVMRDIEQRFVDGGMKAIDKNLGRMVEKGKLPADEKAKILGRVKGTVDQGLLRRRPRRRGHNRERLREEAALQGAGPELPA